MPAPQLTDLQLLQVAEAYKRLGTFGYQLIEGMKQNTFKARARFAVQRGLLRYEEKRSVSPEKPMPGIEELRTILNKTKRPQPQVALSVSAAIGPDAPDFTGEALVAILKKQDMTVEQIMNKWHVTKLTALRTLEELQTSGVNLYDFGGVWSMSSAPKPKHAHGGELPVYQSREDNTYKFGFTSDNHIGSKYARLDVLNDLYDQFQAQGVDRVFNAGNWIDGEARFNKHDLLVHGMDRQIQSLVDNYPQRPGIVTYAVAGDDHEGWYCQREGVDIGRYAENAMRMAGREDWIDMGYMEAYIRLVNANTGKETKLHLVHPGGGTAYAISYTVQKIVEAYDGGEKPALLLAGHYHKLSYNIVRNVHAIQTGTTEDQTPFMRKKKLSAHVGGGVCEVTQDPETGAIKSCKVEFFTYFVRDYYNNRWNMSSDVTLASRMDK